MALRNKDGTPYRTSNPNPLTQQQVQNGNLIFHNFTWEGLAAPDTRRITPVLPKKEILPSPPVVIPVVSAPKPEPKLEPKPEPKPVIEKIKPANTVVVYCLPLTEWRQKEDALYGDSYKTPVYGAKFSFEAVITERADLAISLWTPATMKSQQGTVNTTDFIKTGSIVFPSLYAVDGSKVRDHRWWKVQRIVAYGEGAIITAVATDVQPSFTD